MSSPPTEPSRGPPSSPLGCRGPFPTRAHGPCPPTAGLRGIGGTIRSRPEDFLVEEIPAYRPSGEGEHLALLVQKTGLSTLQMIAILARHFRVPVKAIGYAGLKDKHAVTRQWVTVHIPAAAADARGPVRHGRLEVIESSRHGNKIRRGHLRGNRFQIRVRGFEPTPDEASRRAARVLEALADRGVPNRFGEQRFGHAQNNHLVGRAMLAGDDQYAVGQLLLPEGDDRPEHQTVRALIRAGDYARAADLLPDGADAEVRVLRGLAAGRPPRSALRMMSYVARSFYLSAFQSAVFNAVLDARIADGTWDRLVEGDLAFKHGSGAVFAVDGPTLADPETTRRLAQRQIGPSGPMWGVWMASAGGAVAAVEERALRDAGLEPAVFERFRQEWGEELRGDRRPLSVPLDGPAARADRDDHGDYIECRFELPAGSFATVVMDEVTRAPASDPGATQA